MKDAKLAELQQRPYMTPEEIGEEQLTARLLTARWPDPDLLIRTSGEQRISNYLLWELAYAEFVFTDALWPDFTEEDLTSAVRAFDARDRRSLPPVLQATS